MAGKPTRRKGWELFAHPAHQNQRRYEALRAYLYEGASLAQAAARFGYTPATLESLARDLHAGKLTLFTPAGKPGPKHAPKKTAPAPGSSACAARACRCTRSAPGWPPRGSA
jgi:transposase-like protein